MGMGSVNPSSRKQTCRKKVLTRIKNLNGNELALLSHAHQQIQMKTNNVVEAYELIGLRIHKAKI